MLTVVPAKPVALNYGLRTLDFGLLWGIVAFYFGLQVGPYAGMDE